ncbi:MAG TPA: alanine racemase [Rhodospirillaceae bacterium]|nr:alanine racemase [Rhodospirillaceae bacterium]
MTPYALIDLATIAANYRFLCDKAGKARCGAAVKANAYGLGLVPVASALKNAGCTNFFTAHFSEALALRAHIKDGEIVVLHGLSKNDFAQALAHNITPMLNHLGAVQEWGAFSRERGESLPAMIHLDTGMNRLGLSPAEQAHLAAHHDLLDGIEIKAWASHFACADEFDNPMTTQQRDRLNSILSQLPSAPISLCNSSGLFWGEDYHFDLARPGVALYGGNPTPHLANPMKAVMTLHSPILQIRDVEAAMTVGYAASHSIKRKGRVATIALGYADGYHRALSNKGTVMIGQHQAPLIGRVSMDLITLDVTDVPEAAAHVGADVTLIGAHRTIDQAADEAGTICYELLTSLGERVRRDYLNAA